ncbi:MAG: peptidoglycan DD-metalloendopeptidase family protein [Cyanobacteriota bacterium]
MSSYLAFIPNTFQTRIFTMVFYRRIFTALLCTPILFPLTASIATDLRDRTSIDDLTTALMGIEREAPETGTASPTSDALSTKMSDREMVGQKAIVRFGDTLEIIASRYGLSVDQLMRLNPELNQSPLIVGRQLRLQSTPGTSRIHPLISMRPSNSGGVSWPETPTYDRSPTRPMEAGPWLWPTNGVFTSAYGWRWGRMHKGIDIANNVGTPILAAQSGEVTFAGWSDGGYGYLVELTHPDGSRSLYAHQSRILVQVGEEVRKGQQIGQMGSTGRSTGPHLHFEIHAPGLGAVNPMEFLRPSA